MHPRAKLMADFAPRPGRGVLDKKRTNKKMLAEWLQNDYPKVAGLRGLLTIILQRLNGESAPLISKGGI
jgi:hypothetical protein